MKIHRPYASRRQRVSVRAADEGGFSALELLVIAVIVCTVVAIGVPTLHSRAKAAVLDANVQSLASIVSGLVVEGYSTTYEEPGHKAKGDFVSDHLQSVLEGMGATGYMNPLVGAADGRKIVNSATLPDDPRSAAPAVFITDCGEVQYEVFDALPAVSRDSFAGTIVVAFDTASLTVDVFYVDAKSNKSPSLVKVPTG